MWLEFKLTYYNVTVQSISQYAMSTPKMPKWAKCREMNIKYQGGRNIDDDSIVMIMVMAIVVVLMIMMMEAVVGIVIIIIMVVLIIVMEMVKIMTILMLFCKFTSPFLFFREIWFYIYWGSARGVMVIVVGNGHDDSSSNPGQDWLHFT